MRRRFARGFQSEGKENGASSYVWRTQHDLLWTEEQARKQLLHAHKDRGELQRRRQDLHQVHAGEQVDKVFAGIQETGQSGVDGGPFL